MGVNYIFIVKIWKGNLRQWQTRRLQAIRPNLSLSLWGGQLGPNDWPPNYKEAPYKGVY